MSAKRGSSKDGVSGGWSRAGAIYRLANSRLEDQNRNNSQESNTCNQSKHGKFVGHFVPLPKKRPLNPTECIWFQTRSVRNHDELRHVSDPTFLHIERHDPNR